MPNWNRNAFTTTNPEIIKIITDRLADHKDGIFGAFIPMPEELTEISTGAHRLPDGTVLERWRYKDGEAVALTKAYEAKLQRKYGALDWYDWAKNNWGTKGEPDIDLTDLRETAEGPQLSLWFMTAWTPPIEWFKHITNRHPEGVTTLAYAEGGAEFYGYVEIEDGRVTRNWERDDYWADNDYKSMSEACELHCMTHDLGNI